MFGVSRWRQGSMALGIRSPVPPWATSRNRPRYPTCSYSFSAVPAVKTVPAEDEEIALFRHYREKHYGRTISIQVPVVRRSIVVKEQATPPTFGLPLREQPETRQIHASTFDEDENASGLKLQQYLPRRQLAQFQPRGCGGTPVVKELQAHNPAGTVVETGASLQEPLAKKVPAAYTDKVAIKVEGKLPVVKGPVRIDVKVPDAKQQEKKIVPEDATKDTLVVDSEKDAEKVVELLEGKYKDEVHACDTEVAEIDVKKESPVGHGKLVCFSIYCGPNADFGGGKSRLWVDILKGGEKVLDAFKSYFANSDIKKVWHNYSFDKHIFESHGVKVSGFHADTMHLARLWDSARGGYSLEALTCDSKVMDELPKGSFQAAKTSMKDLFAKTNIKKDGTEGKLKVIPPIEELQTSNETRDLWIYYSAHDAVCTWYLWTSLKKKLQKASWYVEKEKKGNMFEFYEQYMRHFGDLLVKMEAEGMLVDRAHLAEVEKIALSQKQLSVSRFQKWASSYCPDAIHMNVCSDAQIRQLLFGGCQNKKDPTEVYPTERAFKVPNTDNFIDIGAKSPKKHRTIVLGGINVKLPVSAYTPSGWPAVNGAVLKSLAGNVAVGYEEEEEEADQIPSESSRFLTSGGVEGNDEGKDVDLSVYGKAHTAFGGGEAGKKACMAFAALCELSSIDTLISNFIQPLQSGQILGADGRVHCSLNLNTETGRLSARRPNLQNQPALEKDRYKIRKAFIAAPGNSLIVADYGQLELRILAHLSGCKSMLEAFEAGGDFHSRTAMNMYPHVREAVEDGKVLLEWEPQAGETKPPVPMLKDMFASERRKAKMLNFSIAYGKTAMGLSKDWKVSLQEAQKTLELWYKDRAEVKEWQNDTIEMARITKRVHTLLGRSRHLPEINSSYSTLRSHLERAAINTPVQGSAADVAMCAMLEIDRNDRLRELGWKLILQVHDEVILEGPTATCEEAQKLVVQCMSFPFNGQNFLRVKLDVDADHAGSWYEAK